MKKFLILNYGLHISGVSRTLVNFANSLVNHGYDVTIKLFANDFTLANELDSRVKCSLYLNEWRVFGYRVRGFLRFYQIFLGWLERLPVAWQYRLIVRENYDVEIAFNRGVAARIIAASRNKSAKKLVWIHTDYMRSDNALAGFEGIEDARGAYAKFDKIVCVSEQVRCSFVERIGGDERKIISVANIIDADRVRDLADEVTVSRYKSVMLAVGRLCEAKNYRLLLDVASELNSRGQIFQLWIIGDGELREELLQYKERLGLNNVVFWGAKENPYPYFKAADLYVCSSLCEGLSTTTIEALILGKPVLVTDCTGMKDILGENQWGVIVPAEVCALADAIEKMLTDEEHRRHYANQAKVRAKAFEPEECFGKIEELFFDN